MSDLLDEWNLLDKSHKEFVLRVLDSRGGKHGADPTHAETKEPDGFGGMKQIALWEKTEESGFVQCVGSYKWLVTDKFIKLHREQLGI
jgi:hypothetical protein